VEPLHSLNCAPVKVQPLSQCHHAPAANDHAFGQRGHDDVGEDPKRVCE
jgi:hypothetical protein